MKPSRPKSDREKMADNLRGINYYARSSGKPPYVPLIDLPAKRERVKSAVPTESQEQIAFVKWFRLQYPGVRIFAIPNGGARDAITGAILKAEGVDPGVPDTMIPDEHLFIEFKRIKGSKTSDEQLGWHEYLRGCGYTVIVAFGCEDAMEKVKHFLGDLR